MIAKDINSEVVSCRVYKIRWLILFTYVLYSACSFMQWIQYSIIADVVVKYYHVSYIAVDWTAMIYLLLYIVFIFPGSFLLDKLNLKTIFLLGMGLTCVGAWIKVASVAPGRFWILLLGQSIVGISQVLILPLPPKLAAVWFGPNEVSTACSIGIIGNQIGIGAGFLIPPYIVNNQTTQKQIEQDLFKMAFWVAVVNSTVLLFICLLKREPPLPPSSAQMQIQKNYMDMHFFTRCIKRLLVNPSYLLLLISYGINIGVFYAFSTLLNQIVLKHYPDSRRDAGTIGLIVLLAGVVGSAVCGILLDVYNRYKETTIAAYVLSLIGMIAFTYTLAKGIYIIYVIAVIVGFSMIGVTTIGFELAVELTYPEPQGTTTGVLTSVAQVFGITFNYLYSYLFYEISDVCANSVLCVVLFFGLILISCIRYDLRRHLAQTG